VVLDEIYLHLCASV